MRLAATISAALHIGVLVVVYFGLPWLFDPEIPEVMPVIEMEFVRVDDKTNLPAPAPTPEPKAKEEEPKREQAKPKPKPQPAPPPPPEPKLAEPEPEPAPKPEPKPVPKVAEVKPEKVPLPQAKPKPKPKPPEKPKVVEKPKPTPKAPPKKPERKKDTFDASRLAALLDKKLEKEKARPKEKAESRKSAAPKPQASSTQPANLERPMSLSEIDALRRQIERCWSVPAGARDAEDLVVKVRFSLNPDGSLRGSPVIVDGGIFRNEFHRVAAESALRAVLKCQPFKLPVEKYSRWRDMELTFNPKEMLGG